jgi:hypothetical protein
VGTQVGFRVGRIVYAASYEDETIMGGALGLGALFFDRRLPVATRALRSA